MFVTLLGSACALFKKQQAFYSPAYGVRTNIQQGDVSLGMSQDQVHRAWGNPSQVWNAGATRSGNQKWVYAESPHYRHGVGQARVLYFESGLLSGWESGSHADSVNNSYSAPRRRQADWY